MQVSITRFRQDLFRLAEKALEGEPVQFVYKGIVFQVKPEGIEKRKLDRLVAQPTLLESGEPDQAATNLAAQMEAEWLKDWAEI